MRAVTNIGLVVVAALALVAVAAPPDVSGNWDIEANFDDSTLAGGGFDCAFKQEGERLTGNCMAVPLTGEVKGTRVGWQIKAGQTQQTITYTGAVNDTGTIINGRFSMADKGGRFTGSKQ
jgi:hypothetical protein